MQAIGLLLAEIGWAIAGLGVGGFTAVAIGAAVVVGGSIAAAKAMGLFEIEMPQMDSDASRQTTIKSTVAPQKIIYGEALVSGPISYIALSGANNADLYQTIVLAGHKVNAITDIHFDDEVITNAQIAAGLSTGSNTAGNVTGGTFGPINSNTICIINKHLGAASQAADPMLEDKFDLYTTAHRGEGIAYLAMKWTLDEDSAEVWEKYSPGNVKALVQGKPVYDPRLEVTAGGTAGANPTTAAYVAYSTNPALCVTDYLIDQNLGMGIAANKIDWAAVITAATGCDVDVNVPNNQTQKRFTANGVLFGTDSHQKNINKLLSAMNGRLIYSNGKYIVKAGIYEAPTEVLTEDDLIGAIQIKTSLERSDRFNTIRGIYVDASANNKSTEFPKVQLADAVNRDNGEVLEKEIQLPMVSDSYQAQRIANKLIQLSDQQKIVSFPANLSALRITAGDRIQVTVSELGWSDKVFECIGWTFSDDGGVNLTLREDSSTSYGDPLPAAYSQITSDGVIADGFRGVPSPSGLRAASGEKKVFLNWVNPGKPSDFGTIEIYASASNNIANAVKIGETDGTQFVHDGNNAADQIAVGNTRVYWVRSKKNVGTDSSAVSVYQPNSSTGVGPVTVLATLVDWDNVANPTIGIDLNANDTISINLGSSTGTSGELVTKSGIEQEVEIVQGGITMNQGGSIKGGQSAYNSGTGFFLGYDTNAYKFSIGNSSTEALTFDGTNLAVTGNIAATSGSIGNSVTVGGTAASTVASGAAAGATASQVNAGLALLLNKDTFGNTNSGEASLVSIDKDGVPILETSSTTSNGFIQWNGSKITVEAVQYTSSATSKFTVLTGLAGKRGFIVFDTTKSNPFTVAGVAMDVAFAYKEGNQWYYDNNSSAITFTPTNDMVALGYLETSTSDTILKGGLINPVTLTAAAFPSDELKSGSIGGINIDGSKIYSGTSPTWGNTNTGFYLDNTGKFSLKDSLTFDPSTGSLQVSGSVETAILTVTDQFNLLGNTFFAHGVKDGAISADMLAGSAINLLQGSLAQSVGGSNGDFKEGTGTFTTTGGSIVLGTSGNLFDHGELGVDLEANFSISWQGSTAYSTDSLTLQFQASTDGTNYTNIGTGHTVTITALDLSLFNPGDYYAYFSYTDITETIQTSSASPTPAGQLANNVDYYIRALISSVPTSVTGQTPSFTFSANEGVTGVTSTGGNADTLDNLDSTAFLRSNVNDTFDADLVITGNLTVQGTTTTINVADLTVADKDITLNYSTGDSSATANNAGIIIQDAVSATTDASILWKTANDSFEFSHPVLLSGVGGLTTTGGNNLTVSGSVADHAGLIFATHAILPAEAGAEASANVIDIGANGNEFKSLYLNTSIINDSGFTIDSGGDIILDADGGDILFADGGTTIGFIGNSSSDMVIKSQVQDKDLIFKGNDGGSTITALTLDMSAAGAATFSGAIDQTSSAAFITIESTSASQNSQLNITSTVGSWLIGQNSLQASTGALEFNYGGVAKLAIASTGAATFHGSLIVGSTTTPRAALQVAKGITSGAPAAGAATGAACFGNDTSSNNYGLVMGADGFGKGYISAQRTDGTATTYDLKLQPNGGNLLVNTTSQISSGKLSVAGGSSANGITATTSATAGYAAASFQRTASNGELIGFKQGTANVGSIGVVGSNQPYLVGATAGGFAISHLNSTNAVIVPVTATGANSDATHDIGYTGKRFRNIVLSGTANVGSVTAGGLTVDGGANSELRIDTDAAGYLQVGQFTNGAFIGTSSTNATYGKLRLGAGTKRFLDIDVTGDISFYEDTGTTPKFFWDASAESLGIGATAGTYDSRANNLVVGDSGDAGVTIFSGATSVARLVLAASGDTGLANGVIGYDNNNDSLAFEVAGSERIRITSNGTIQISGNGSGNDSNAINFVNGAVAIARDDNNLKLHAYDNMIFGVSGTSYPTSAERMRISSDGTVLVGKTAEGTATDGIELNRNDVIVVTRNGDAPLLLNRRTSDGGLAVFRRDNSTIGSLGVFSSATYIQSGSAASYTGLYLNTNRIEPVRESGGDVRRDATVSLGSSGYRFADLYLSGKASVDTLQFAQNSSAIGATEAVYRATTGVIAFKTNSNEHMRLDPSGRLAIGTDSPAAKLHIENGDIRIEKDTKVTIGFRGHTTGSTALAFRDASAAVDRMTLNSSGHLLVGATSADIGGSTTGIRLSANGQLMASSSGTGTYNYPAYFDRRGTNNSGDSISLGLQGFVKCSIGVIGTSSGTNDGQITFNTWANAVTRTERLRIEGATGTVFVGGKLVLGTDDVATNTDANLTIKEGNAFAGIDVKSLRTSGNIGGLRSFNANNSIVNQFLMRVDGKANLVNSGGLMINTAVVIDGSRNITAGTIVASGNVTAYSDARLKDNIKTLDGSKVLEMRGVFFTKDGKAGSGVIAQEIEQIAPELVEDDGTYKSVAYGNLVGYLIESAKEQQSEIDELKALVRKLMEK